MSDDTQNNSGAKRPSHLAYQVNEGQDGKSFFNKVGAAFEHRDGMGFNIVLDAVPVDGRITLRTPKERLNDMREQPQRASEAQKEPERER